MSSIESELEHFIHRMKFDIKTTRDFMGEDPRMVAVANAQESFIMELEEVLEESRGYGEI